MNSFSRLTADQVRETLRGARERNFSFIDVREPEEFSQGHLPGALLLPLGELARGGDATLPGKGQLYFYCRSGARSAAAAVMAVEYGVDPERVISMDGGYMAWNGLTITNVPRTTFFGVNTDLSTLLHRAAELEKGAWRLYTSLAQHPDHPLFETLSQLAEWETRHARAIFALAKKHGDVSDQRFETYFERLRGDIVEGGIPIEEFLSDTAAATCLDVTELALSIEVAAYDLYKHLALNCRSEHAQKAFLALAQQEKGHIALLARGVADCPPPPSLSGEKA